MKKISFFTIIIALAFFIAPTNAGNLDRKDVLIIGSTNAVYYHASDGKRYVFANQKIYDSWFTNFFKIIQVTDSELASLPLGGNIRYRPGIKLVKIATDPKVYAVDRGGILRWVTTETVAISLYGAGWAKNVDDISVAFFINYTVGAPIESASDFSPSNSAASATTINQNRYIAETAGARQSDTSVQFINTACNDKIDNDGDGLIDLADPGCSNSSDNDEFNLNYQDISYGSFGEYNTLDLWLAASTNPTPLVVFIHGGGFYEGSKEDINTQHYYPEQDSSLVDIFLESGISVASINYRLTQNHPEWAYTQEWYDSNPVPAAMFDSGEAISFLRDQAEEYNIDTSKIAATGFSAGGGISLWLAFNADISPLAKPNCIGPWNAQSTYDPRTIFELMPDTDLYKNFFVLTFYNINPSTFNLSQADNYDILFRGASPITHVSAGDPPVFMYYPKVSLYDTNGALTNNIHNPIFGINASTYFDDLNIPYELYYRENPQDGLISEYAAALRMRDFFLENCFN